MRFEKSQIYGGVEFAELLKAFPARLQKEIVNEATKKTVMEVFAKLVKENIESKYKSFTGNLLAGVTVKKFKGLDHAYRLFMSAPAYHAHFFEYGTVKYRKAMGIKTDRDKIRYTRYARPALVTVGWRTITHTGGIKKNAFFRPAIDEGKEMARNVYSMFMLSKMGRVTKQMSQEYNTLSKTFKKKLGS